MSIDIAAIKARWSAIHKMGYRERADYSIQDVPALIAEIEHLTAAIDGLHKANSDLTKEVERLREENRWIPVSERLPEVNKPVLCFSQDAEVEFRVDVDIYGELSHRFINAHATGVTVTHWRLLPQSPKEKL